jgi:molybdopterin-guanine dinucleotide biosynthesis protein A
VGDRDAVSDRSAISGAIVAGGESARFSGQPKGLFTVGGVRIIDRVAAALRGVVEDIVLVANQPDATQWLRDVPVEPDQRTERGSLVGLETAVRHAPGPVLVVAWDMPFVTSNVLALVVNGLTARASAVVPDGPRGPEPMCALYTPRCLPAMERAIERGDMRLASFVRRLPGVVRIPLDRVSAVGNPAQLFFNVNDRHDLELAERMARTQ